MSLLPSLLFNVIIIGTILVGLVMVIVGIILAVTLRKKYNKK